MEQGQELQKKAEQALNKIASAQLLLEALAEQADIEEIHQAIHHLCEAYDLLSDWLNPSHAEEDSAFNALGPDFIQALMEQMIHNGNKE